MATIILVHGMGQHTDESFKNDFINACEKAFDLYPSLEGKKVNDLIEVVSIGYNDIFDNRRSAMADRASTLTERLNSLGDLVNYPLGKLVNKIKKMESSINDDDFFKTHWLDVFFYRYTILGEQVRIKVGEGILDVLKREQSQQVHILGHSLGTSVVHDTLAKLYSSNFIPGETDYLSTTSNKFGSLHMVANTSRALESFVEVDKSTVKPGPKGCCSNYLEYKHIFDPITWVKPFTPSDNNGWISHDSFRIPRYELHQPTSITNEHGNTHSLAHYLFNPMVHVPLFDLVFDIGLSESQINKGHDSYIAKTMSGVARELERELGNLRVHNQENVESILLAANKLKEFVEKLGGQYNG